MSHVETKSVDLGEELNPELVEEAIKLMADTHGFFIKEDEEYIYNYVGGEKTKTDVVLHKTGQKYPVGINYKNGKVEILGETYCQATDGSTSGYGTSEVINSVNEWMTAAYSAVAYGSAMQETGEFDQIEYTFTMDEEEDAPCYQIEGISLM